MTYPGWDKATNEDVLALFKDVDKGEVKFIEKH